MNKELEEAIKQLKKVINAKTGCDYEIALFEFGEYAETVLKELKRLQEDYIEKDKIREKLEELNKEGYWDFLEQRDLEKTIKILKELLEEK